MRVLHLTFTDRQLQFFHEALTLYVQDLHRKGEPVDEYLKKTQDYVRHIVYPKYVFDEDERTLGKKVGSQPSLVDSLNDIHSGGSTNGGEEIDEHTNEVGI